MKKPPWIKVTWKTNPNFKDILHILQTHNLHTVCQEALCPNRAHCWGQRTATIMILGDVCTRSCKFCAVKTGRPKTYDREEPKRVAQAVQKMGLHHVVITSVNRDELPDQGSQVWAETIQQIRLLNPHCSIEVLTPDFQGNLQLLQTVFEQWPDIFSHNLETVQRLNKFIRPQGSYQRSLNVLKASKQFGLLTKTSLMLGLGETKNEVLQTMQDAKEIGVDILNLGQYLQPTPKHHPVQRYVHPDEFEEYKTYGYQLGFQHVESAPLVRSSYHAQEQAQCLQIQPASPPPKTKPNPHP